VHGEFENAPPDIQRKLFLGVPMIVARRAKKLERSEAKFFSKQKHIRSVVDVAGELFATFSATKLAG
jgi:hypothetical protein